MPAITALGVAALAAVAAPLGVAGARRLRRPQLPARRADVVGLPGLDQGLGTLAAELDRAQLHDRPLTLATVTAQVTGAALAELDDVDARRALVAVARAVKHNLRITDVPFALDASGERFAVVLPETTPDAAYDVLGSVLLAVGEATFEDGARASQRSVADVTRIELRSLDATTAPVLPGRTRAAEALVVLRRAEDLEPVVVERASGYVGRHSRVGSSRPLSGAIPVGRHARPADATADRWAPEWLPVG